MKIPIQPPKFSDLVQDVIDKSPQRFSEIIALGIPPDPNGRYYHWDKLRHLKNIPVDLDHKEWWLAIKLARKTLYKSVPHTDKHGNQFVFAEPDIVRKLLHDIDIHGGGELRSSEPVANPRTRDSYLINSLIEEAITSSQLEGAATTRNVAKEMLRQKRKPQGRSETMIVNNYHAMQFINTNAQKELTSELILELHGILTHGTLENENAIGRLRKSDDIFVSDNKDGSIIHKPPKAAELKKRLTKLCNFANNKNTSIFLHPVIRAILLHFMLAYDHPFEDGNGRTARALFYWSMLSQGYWTMEYISISRILRNAPAKYVRSYLYTETDDQDTTYFLVHQLEVIVRAINDLHKYLETKAAEIQSVVRLLKTSPYLQNLLNHRQIALINRALKKPDSVFHIASHQGAHNVTYDTARTDLLKLVDLGLLEKTKIGKAFVFLVVGKLEDKMRELTAPGNSNSLG